MDIDKLEASPEVKLLLRKAKSEVCDLRKKLKNERMKNYRTKGVKNIDTLLSHLKKKKFFGDKVVEVLKVSRFKVEK